MFLLIVYHVYILLYILIIFFAPNKDYLVILCQESKFNEFEPCLKSAKNRFQLSAGLNLEILKTILSVNNHI